MIWLEIATEKANLSNLDAALSNPNGHMVTSQHGAAVSKEKDFLE